jgi:hypothetical protein
MHAQFLETLKSLDLSTIEPSLDKKLYHTFLYICLNAMDDENPEVGARSANHLVKLAIAENQPLFGAVIIKNYADYFMQLHGLSPGEEEIFVWNDMDKTALGQSVILKRDYLFKKLLPQIRYLSASQIQEVFTFFVMHQCLDGMQFIYEYMKEIQYPMDFYDNLQVAIRFGKIESVQLLTQWFNPFEHNKHNPKHSCLKKAIEFQQIEIAKKLICQAPGFIIEDKCSPFYEMISMSCDELFTWFIDKVKHNRIFITVNEKNYHQFKQSQHIINNAEDDIQRLLSVCFNLVIEFNNQQLFHFLIEQGVNTHLNDEQAIKQACEHDCSNALSYLWNEVIHQGMLESLYAIAIYHHSFQCLLFLEKHGVNFLSNPVQHMGDAIYSYSVHELSDSTHRDDRRIIDLFMQRCDPDMLKQAVIQYQQRGRCFSPEIKKYLQYHYLNQSLVVHDSVDEMVKI